MLKRFHILTVSHKHTQLSTLADLAIQAPDEDALRTKLLRLKSEFGLDELMYMATCNRVMYAFSTANPVNAGFIGAFTDLIHPRLSEAQLTEYTGIFQLLSGMDAVNHLFEVAASIDSLVVGERQILRQLREAYERSSAWGLTGDTIKLALQHAIVAAKSVYSKTGIGEKSVSVVALAIRQLLQKPLNEDTRILFIGAFSVAGEHIFELNEVSDAPAKRPVATTSPRRASTTAVRRAPMPKTAAPTRTAVPKRASVQPTQVNMPVPVEEYSEPQSAPVVQRQPVSSRVRQRPPRPNGMRRSPMGGLQARSRNQN